MVTMLIAMNETIDKVTLERYLRKGYRDYTHSISNYNIIYVPSWVISWLIEDAKSALDNDEVLEEYRNSLIQIIIMNQANIDRGSKFTFWEGIMASDFIMLYFNAQRWKK